MIVFALYLHVCSTQLTSMHGGAPARVVTACSMQPAGNPYTDKPLCDAAGKLQIGQEPDTGRAVDAYECRPITLNSK